jgi:ribosomal protein S18 acetylase RimI-like enzyme
MTTDSSPLQHLVIRLVRADDLPRLEWDGAYRHYREVFRANFDDMRRGQRLMWVAELNGTLVGQIFCQFLSADPAFADGQRRAYLYAFRVRTPLQGRGVGSRLLATAESELLQRHFRTAVIAAAKDNPRAREMYERRGYQVFAEDPGLWSYRDDQGREVKVEEPAWLLQKSL